MTVNERIQVFTQIPEVSAWYKAADLKPRTRENYSLRLMQLLERMQLSPTQFLKECDSNRKQILGRIKQVLGEVREHSASIAHQQRAALVSFLAFYQDQFDEPLMINYKVKLKTRTHEKGFDIPGRGEDHC